VGSPRIKLGLAANAFHLKGDRQQWDWCHLSLKGATGEKRTINLGADELFNNIATFLSQGYFVVASVADDHGQIIWLDNGLVSNHLFSLLSVAVLHGHEEDTRLICLRNPWGGHQKWRGAWSDGDEKWQTHPEAETLGYEPASDGIFWMQLEDFAEHFNVVTFCNRSWAVRGSPDID